MGISHHRLCAQHQQSPTTCRIKHTTSCYYYYYYYYYGYIYFVETDNPENNRTNKTKKQTFVTQSKSAVLLLYPYPCQCAGDLNSWTKFRRSCSCRPSSTISVFKYSTDAEVFRASRTNGDTSDNLKCEKPTN